MVAAACHDGSCRLTARGIGARVVGRGFWQDGRRLVLWCADDVVLWEGGFDCRAVAGAYAGGTVRYCDGTELRHAAAGEQRLTGPCRTRPRSMTAFLGLARCPGRTVTSPGPGFRAS
ncbi:hypothetical protein GCM10010521_17440 [Streptomyces rameus]|uniref:Uncharacterized protein n=1 Tax=Streptomyces rameus TaxID=68261 RepID=A0ABP6N0W9_9ACTN